MGQQLKLPIFEAPLPGAVQGVAEALRSEPPVIASERAQETPEPEGGPDPFARLHDELERLYIHLQGTIPYGPAWKKAWDKARADTCESHGWSEADFYAELRRRIEARRKST